ncbi:hypothetical protein CO613_05750 [Lysobacteraceae bacterium NML07-0707]|nr:hypothetical protein CO613_05750 [Xanthomonadaceae bacterium NML07-0707]
MSEEKQLIASLVARTVVAEKALQLLFARAHLPEDAHTLLQLNLQMQRLHLQAGLTAAGLPDTALEAAEEAYAHATEAVLQAAHSGKYSAPTV